MLYKTRLRVRMTADERYHAEAAQNQAVAEAIEAVARGVLDPILTSMSLSRPGTLHPEIYNTVLLTKAKLSIYQKSKGFTNLTYNFADFAKYMQFAEALGLPVSGRKSLSIDALPYIRLMALGRVAAEFKGRGFSKGKKPITQAEAAQKGVSIAARSYPFRGRSYLKPSVYWPLLEEAVSEAKKYFATGPGYDSVGYYIGQANPEIYTKRTRTTASWAGIVQGLLTKRGIHQGAEVKTRFVTIGQLAIEGVEAAMEAMRGVDPGIEQAILDPKVYKGKGANKIYLTPIIYDQLHSLAKQNTMRALALRTNVNPPRYVRGRRTSPRYPELSEEQWRYSITSKLAKIKYNIYRGKAAMLSNTLYDLLAQIEPAPPPIHQEVFTPTPEPPPIEKKVFMPTPPPPQPTPAPTPIPTLPGPAPTLPTPTWPQPAPTPTPRWRPRPRPRYTHLIRQAMLVRQRRRAHRRMLARSRARREAARRTQHLRLQALRQRFQRPSYIPRASAAAQRAMIERNLIRQGVSPAARAAILRRGHLLPRRGGYRRGYRGLDDLIFEARRLGYL